MTRPISSLYRIARHLPAAGARWLGRRSPGNSGSAADLQRSSQAVAAALPTATAQQHRQIARESLRRAAADRWLQAWTEGQDDRQLCRRLELAGWDHLTEVPQAVFAIAPCGLPQLAIRALVLYRDAADAHSAKHSEPTELAQLSGLMAQDRSVACRLDLHDAHHTPCRARFLQGGVMINTLAMNLALECSAPLVPVIAQATDDGGFRMVVAPAIDTSARHIADLSEACLAAWLSEIACDPARWHWHSLPAPDVVP